MTKETFTELALSFVDVVEQPHFNATSFRINGKIFASFEKGMACLKLTKDDQTEFCRYDKAICPVDNHWGKSGWTYIGIDQIREELLVDALTSAYNTVLGQNKNHKT